MWSNRWVKLAGLAALLVAGSSQAAIVNQLDSASFDYEYEQDVRSSTQDLDTNGTADFYNSNAGELPSISGGIASFSDGDFYRTDFTGSITRAQFADNAPFTIEIRAKMLTTGSADGTRGTMGIFWRDPGSDTQTLYIGDSSVMNQAGTTISSASNTDDFHVFRLARDTDGDFWFWRDGVLLAQDVAALSITGASGLYVGDTGSANQGNWQLDYLRIAKGAYAPVVTAIPSPAAASSLLLMTPLLYRRRAL